MANKQEYSKKYYQEHKEHIKTYQKEYQKEYRKKNIDRIRKYQREYQREYAQIKGINKPRILVRYGIYNLNDEYVFEGTIQEIAEYSGRTKKNLYSSMSNAKHRKGLIKINGKKVRFYKMED